jgi:hypothetical protein
MALCIDNIFSKPSGHGGLSVTLLLETNFASLRASCATGVLPPEDNVGTADHMGCPLTCVNAHVIW